MSAKRLEANDENLYTRAHGVMFFLGDAPLAASMRAESSRATRAEPHTGTRATSILWQVLVCSFALPFEKSPLLNLPLLVLLFL